MQRALRLAALALLVVAAAPPLRAAATPSILRMDVFIASRYDTNTALVLFNSAMMPAGLGVPAGPWPQGATQWMPGARLRLAQSGEEKQWSSRWPGGASFAPQLGAQYVLAMGGGARVRGVLSNIGYLPLCDTTWLVGLVSVDAVDRTAYAGSVAEGMAAYQSTPEVLQAISSVQKSAASEGSAPLAEKERVLNSFPLAMLPMLDQADSEQDRILLTEERSEGGVTYSLKRQTPAGLIPTGVYFEKSCADGGTLPPVAKTKN